MYKNELSQRTPILIALSTCPRCNRIKKFLEMNQITAIVIDYDLLTSGEKKAHLKFLQPLNPLYIFPTLIVGEDVVVGEKYEAVKEVLGL